MKKTLWRQEIYLNGGKHHNRPGKAKKGHQGLEKG